MGGIQLGIGFKPYDAFSDEVGLANLNTEPQRAQKKHRENTEKIQTKRFVDSPPLTSVISISQ